MKVEVGESLIYSYLSHIKECQVVQTNWKISSSWQKYNQSTIDEFIKTARKHFEEKFDYHIFKATTSVSQLLKQCECDVVGVHFDGNTAKFYSVDVAFHEGGLNYKSKKESAERVTAKIIKAAMCLLGSCNVSCGELIFASPKITPSVMDAISPCINEINTLFSSFGLGFTSKLIANKDFKKEILDPILNKSEQIADTSELFVRSYQLLNMFN